MDRGRGGGRGRATKKRATLPNHQQFSESISAISATATPLPVSNTPSHRGGRVRPANPTPHRPSSPTADSFRGTPKGTDRPGRAHTFHPPFFLDSPSAAVNMADLPPSARKRAKTFETTSSFDGADDEAHSKGGHSLRKRTRIDYTQMIDDELGLAAARNGDLMPKTAMTPGGSRSRKRKGVHSQDDSDEDPDEFGSNPNQKRRRVDKEPGHARATSRRRNQARKSMTEISPYVDHPSDNDVQDTIMVGVSMDVAVTDEESDSFQGSESPSSSSSSPPDAKRPNQSQNQSLHQSRPESPSPLPGFQSHPIARVDEPSSYTQPADEHVSSNPQPNQRRPDWVFGTILPDVPTQASQSCQHAGEETLIKKSRSPEPIPLQTNDTSAPVVAPTQPDREEKPAEETSPAQANLGADISTREQHVEERSAEINPAEEKGLNEKPAKQHVEMTHEDVGTKAEPTQILSSKPEPEQGRDLEGARPTTPPTFKQDPESAEKTPSEPISLSQSDGAAVAKSTPEPSPPAKAPIRPVLRAPKPIGPARVGQLEPIYASETPFATQLGLEPYEGEDQVLPGPYTEWVYPGDGTVTPRQTPTPTPTPTPIPSGDRGLVEVVWDATQPLKEKQLFALHKQESLRRKGAGLPPIDLKDFYNDCVRRHKAAKSQLAGTRSGPASAPASNIKVVVENGAETPRSGSQVPESQVPTAAPSPAPADDDALDDQYEEVIERPTPKRNGPLEPVEVTRNYPHQYSFPKVRDPADITQLLENYEELDTTTLYSTVAAAVESLHAYQQEYNELKKILDDEENAKRRQANDKTIVNWENRQNYDEPLPLRRHHDDAIKGPPPFEVRGARAPKPYIDDPVLEHQREEDRIMAQVYGFKHNNHPTQVGRQNPEEQRWEMPETRLRERKRTEKGAELAEENVVEGKRARKPRYVSDQSKDPSRSGTPILAAGTGRRQRKTTALSVVNGDGRSTPEVVLPPPEISTEVTPRKARVAAAARTRQLAEDREETPIPIVAEPESIHADEEDISQRFKPVQKRIRGGANKAPTSAPATEAPKITTNTSKGKGRATRDITSSTFYNNNNHSGNADHERRPSTASSEESNRTAETAESAYSLRDKPKRNFVLENDPELEPRPKRRIRTTTTQNIEPTPAQKADEVNEGKKPKRVRKPTTAATAATNSPAPLEPATSAPAPPPEPAPAHMPVSQPELAYPPPPIAPQQQLPPPPPPPPPAGGLKAPTIFFTNPMTAHSLTPAPPPPGPFMHTFNAVTSFPHSFPPPQADPPAIKKPITRIKVTNGFSQGGQSSSSKNATSSEGRSGNTGKKVTKVKAAKSALSPNGLIDGKLPTLSQLAAEVPEKSYSEMSKSEKMSWSMRRRWASGEMQGAVEKRRTTLANKKAEKANTTPGDGQGSNPGSGASTPQPQSGVLHPPPQDHHQTQQQVMNLPAQGPLALPGPYGDQGYVGMQPPMQMQMQQPQGYGGHGHIPGHPHQLPPPPPPMQMVPGGQPGGQMVFQFPPPPPPQHPHQGLHPGQHY